MHLSDMSCSLTSESKTCKSKYISPYAHARLAIKDLHAKIIDNIHVLYNIVCLKDITHPLHAFP
jgi:hypothetical protein